MKHDAYGASVHASLLVLGQARFRTFANGEISVKLEQSVSNYDVFVVSRQQLR